jgi:AraC-like DNA-binding protein
VTAPIQTPRRYETVSSRDRDEARERIAAVFSPHTLEVVGPTEDLDVSVRARLLPSITLADIRHGTEVVIRPGRLTSYYEINVPIRGFTVSSCGVQETESRPGKAAILNPTEPCTMRWSADCAQLAVKVSRAVVERTLEGVLGYPPEEAVHFSVAFDLTSAPGRSWARAVALLREALDDGAPDLVIRPLEELVVGQLLVAQPHSLTDRLAGEPRPVRPRYVSRVIDLVERDPAAPLSVTDMALEAGTSARSLQAAFTEHLGISPMAYLRKVRLARAHADLQAAETGDGQSVADIAYRWGFGHVPRFAAAYRERYGCAPSQTLRG